MFNWAVVFFLIAVFAAFVGIQGFVGAAIGLVKLIAFSFAACVTILMILTAFISRE